MRLSATLRRFALGAHRMSIILYRIIIITFLLVILGSLASALFFLVKDKGQSDRTLKALTVRISLSVGLFLLLMAGFYFGIIPPRH
jgi:hypothetical protein